MPVVVGASTGWAVGLVLGVVVVLVAAAIVITIVVLAMRIASQARTAVDGVEDVKQAYLRKVSEELRAVPGVESVAVNLGTRVVSVSGTSLEDAALRAAIHAAAISGARTCHCDSALQYAIITDRSAIPDSAKSDLAAIAGKYLG